MAQQIGTRLGNVGPWAQPTVDSITRMDYEITTLYELLLLDLVFSSKQPQPLRAYPELAALPLS